MLDAAVKALSQLLSRPFRTVLLKAIGLSLILILLIGVGLHRLLMWLATSGEVWAAGALGATWQGAVQRHPMDRVDRRGARDPGRIRLPDAGGDGSGGELLRRRDRRDRRA